MDALALGIEQAVILCINLSLFNTTFQVITSLFRKAFTQDLSNCSDNAIDADTILRLHGGRSCIT